MLIWPKAFVLFGAICLLSSSFGVQWVDHGDAARNISQALVDIVTHIYVNKSHRKVFNFHVKVTNKSSEHMAHFGKITDEILSLLNDNITVLLKNGAPIPPNSERQFCVLLVDSAESLKFLYRELIKFHLFIYGSYLIILEAFPNTHHYYDELYEIFQLNWHHGITHAEVFVHAVENAILLFHNMPFTPFHCRGIAPIVHNKFVDGHWLHKKFTNAKLYNLYGCPIICATWEDLPYFEIDRYRSKGKRLKYGGLEGKLLDYISDKLNFTIQMRWLNDEEINRTIYDEEGIFKELFKNNTDLVLGAFRYKSTSLGDQYAPTRPYYWSNYHFVVSAKTDAYDPFTKLLLPFKIEIWIILIAIFIFVNLMTSILKYLNLKSQSLVLGRKNKTPVYNMVVISLGGAVAKDPIVPFSRHLLIMWLLATFILRTLYEEASFYYTISDVHKPRPKLITDLLQKEYRIFMSDVVYTYITKLPALVAKAEIFDTNELESFEMLRHPQEYEPYKIAVLTAFEYYGFYKLTTPINNDFYVVPEQLFTQYLSIYMKKNSPFLYRFDYSIKNYVSDGLMNYWKRFFVGRDDKQFHNQIYRDDTPRPVKNIHLYAGYRLLFIGLIISLFVFFAEICVYEIKILAGRRHWKFLNRRQN